METSLIHLTEKPLQNGRMTFKALLEIQIWKECNVGQWRNSQSYFIVAKSHLNIFGECFQSTF